MSFKAHRLAAGAAAQPFDWGAESPQLPGASASPPDPPSSPSVTAAVERDAFIKGYAQGEKAGAETAAKRGEGMLRRLSETVEELVSLRAQMVHRTETQLVQLALAIARRVVAREISLDRGLLVGMARVALDRLGEHAFATVRLHPEDYAAVTAGMSTNAPDTHVRIVADPIVRRGSCLVQSDFGFMDVSPEAQFEELARTLLEDGELTGGPAGSLSTNGVVNG